MVDITILTDQRYTHLQPSTDYAKNVILEDTLVMDALINKGMSVHRCAWDDAGMDWVRTKAALFRSTWDYFDRFKEFEPWLNRTQNLTQFINSSKLIRWNMNKSYLSDLNRKGIAVPITKTLKPEESIATVMNAMKWELAIVKPYVSGAGRLTYLANNENAEWIHAQIDPYRRTEEFMVQQFLPSIQDRGEVSLVFFGETFSHAVLKTAKEGDFRVQDDFGGRVALMEVKDSLKQFGLHCLNACPELPVYSRVDVMWDESDQPVLGELELIEPELWFRLHPEAAETFADQILESYAHLGFNSSSR